MVAIKGWTWSVTMLRLAVAFKQCPIGTKWPKVCQENIPHTITPPPACTVVTRHDGSMISFCLRQILTLPSERLNRNRDSSDQATFFQSLTVQFWWALANCSLFFLFVVEMSGVDEWRKIQAQMHKVVKIWQKFERGKTGWIDRDKIGEKLGDGSFAFCAKGQSLLGHPCGE